MRFYFLLTGIIVLASCSRKTDQELYREGQAAEGRQDFQAAVQSYEEVVGKYPQGTYADSAQFLIGKIYNNDLRDIEKAASAYEKVYTSFPQSQFAPTAMFLTGFLLNNDLHKFDSAKLVYQMFLEKYPNHELATSAKFELENLGKDPTEFVRGSLSADTSKQKKSAKR